MINITYDINLSVEKLWKGCMLFSIANAIMAVHEPEFSYEHSWDGFNYSVQDGQGTRGTITFGEEYCIGAFRDDNSERISEVYASKSASEFFKGAPNDVLNIANEEALQYLLDEDFNGNVRPVITTSFWGSKDDVSSIDSPEKFISNGGFILNKELMDFDEAIDFIEEDFEMTPEQIELLKKLFDLKVNKKVETIILNDEDIEKIGSDDEEGMKESKICFEQIGIIWI